VQSEAPAATAPSGAAAAAEPAPASPPASSTTPASSPGHVSSTTATVRSAAGAAPHHRPATPDAGKLRPKDGNAHHQAQHAHHTPAPRHSAPPAAQGVQPALTVTGAPAVLPEIPWALQGRLEDQPPSFLIPIYKEAGLRYHVPWTVLAAINQLETDYGRDLSVSSAGAIGWMQFMPTTWREWAVDADGDALADPYSPRDAIFTAARYLQASGAESDLTGAIYAYNHAGWYVTAVLFRAATLDAESIAAPLERGYSLPLDPTYLKQLGRTDDGVDIETAPDGSLVYSITPGVVSAVASDPAGFGPNYPVVEATSGALAGQHIYYGHVARALVQPGDHVAAGQPIAVVGHTGDAVSLGHGHIEIGFSDAAGAPLDQHGAVPSTPAGEIMRSFLIELAARFGIHTY
jgi:murein DD-endopeptidase MepM/ murein hydrolase activator NlpD